MVVGDFEKIKEHHNLQDSTESNDINLLQYKDVNQMHFVCQFVVILSTY